MAEVYAKGTKVPVEKTRMEIERLLTQHKARATAVFTSPEAAAVCFEMQERRVKFLLTLPKMGSASFDRQSREKWRALLLSIKAKLVSVESGIETFEDAFMAHVVMPDGSTVSEHVRPKIADAYKSQKMVPLLPAPGVQ